MSLGPTRKNALTEAVEKAIALQQLGRAQRFLPATSPSPLTEGEMNMLRSSATEKAWMQALEAIKAVRGGEYPCDWAEKVTVSGLGTYMLMKWRGEIVEETSAVAKKRPNRKPKFTFTKD